MYIAPQAETFFVEPKSEPMNKKKQSQSSLIKNHLISGATLTAIDALRNFGCFRLSGRIYDLKKEGLNIESRTIHSLDGKNFSEYYIKP